MMQVIPESIAAERHSIDFSALRDPFPTFSAALVGQWPWPLRHQQVQCPDHRLGDSIQQKDQARA